MPQLPISQVDARTGRANTPLIQASRDPNVFGAGIGRAMQDLGGSIGDVSTTMQRIEEKRRQEDVANRIAQFDFSQHEIAAQQEVGASGKGYHDLMRQRYPEAVEEAANAIEDDRARQEFRQRMMSALPAVSQRAANYELETMTANGKREANEALAGLQNRIAQDPSSFDFIVGQGNAVIEARADIPAPMRAAMSDAWRNDTANRYFEGRISKARTMDDINAIASEMSGPAGGSGGRDWAKIMKPDDFTRTVNAIDSARTSIRSRAASVADASLASVEDRVKSGAMVGSDELRQAQQAVLDTGDINRQRRMARVMRSQEINRTEAALPAAEIRARINAVNGSPSSAYPTLPVEVSSSINAASDRFGVGASYLGGLVTREYGGYLKVDRPQVQDTFKPILANSSIDVRNIHTQAFDAVTLAGQEFGEPLTVVGAARASGQVPGTGMNISTVGKSPQDKARMVAALVNQGFTGVEESDSYIRVDMRSEVPATFGVQPDGTVYGGWGNLSPEVAAVLQQRGYAPGAKSEVIVRSPALKMQQIDYGKGNPASSAVGVGQFIDSTWLSIMKRDGVAAQMGIDISKMSDSQILDLRKDQQVSVMAAAAYGEQNKKILQDALGRPVDDAELYMAHFMGPGGATQFLTAYRDRPDVAAADIMPQAAASNRPVFFENGRALSVAEVHDKIASSFTMAPDRVAFEDNEQRARLIKQQEQGLATDPMSWAAANGVIIMPDVTQEGGFSALGREAQALATRYNIPVTDMKPLPDNIMNTLKGRIDSGTADQVVQVMANIQDMGADMSRAAMRQLEQKDPVFSYAGSLYLNGNQSVAADIIRGQKNLNDNPALKERLGLSGGGISSTISQGMEKAVGAALDGLQPKYRQSVQEAALAYWVQQSVSSGSAKQFSPSEFVPSVMAVLGGDVVDINGRMTLSPRGITQDIMDGFVSNVSLTDMTRLSVAGAAPRMMDNSLVNFDDIRYEMELVAIGGNQYQIRLGDGSYLINPTTGREARPSVFTVKLDPQDVQRVSSRPVAMGDTVGVFQ